MATPNRSVSPILKIANKRKPPELILLPDKIHRIRLQSDAIGTVVNVDSPSCAWFKLRNHISEQLRYIKPSRIKQYTMPDDFLYSYVMAPLQENVYARGRITKSHGKLVYVHFIDEGYGKWMSPECLAEMEKDFFCHPWQAINFALFKVVPGMELSSLTEVGNWPERYSRLLENILSDYEYFRLVPINNSERNNTYSDYIRADLFGLVGEKDLEGESIAHRFAIEMFSMDNEQVKIVDNFQRGWSDAREQKLLLPVRDLIREIVLDEIPKWRLVFPVDFCDGIKESLLAEEFDEQQEYLNWDPEYVQGFYPCIKHTSLTDLVSMGSYVNRICTMCIEWRSVKSPYEFYAFPCSTKVEEPLRHLFEEQQKWASTLDSFYGHPNNRKPIDSEIVMRTFRNELQPHIYAIYEYNDEMVSCSYRRVQVLAVRNPKSPDYSSEFCRIRFLDVGGNDIVPLAGLIAVHSSHCKRPPMCLQLTLSDMMPLRGGSVWQEDECKDFQRLARSDVAVQCKVTDPEPSTRSVRYNDAPRVWPGVFSVHDLVVEGHYIKDSMAGGGQNAASYRIEH